MVVSDNRHTYGVNALYEIKIDRVSPETFAGYFGRIEIIFFANIGYLPL